MATNGPALGSHIFYRPWVGLQSVIEVFTDHTHLLFSSPEPLAHGELLCSLDVRRASSVVNNCFKGHILLNY